MFFLFNIIMNFFQLRQEYKESNFKQYWMPDENCKECYECGEKFNTFRRRHHCRLCGQIFCYRCCYLEIPGLIMGYTGKYLLLNLTCKHAKFSVTVKNDVKARFLSSCYPGILFIVMRDKLAKL